VASIHELLERGLQRVVEALVFAADSPVEPEEIAEIYSRVTGEERPSHAHIREAVDRLNGTYEETERTFRIEFWAEGFRMATVASVAPFLKSYFNREQEQRLSRSLMETLSIVAYKQPVTKPEIDFVRGVDSGYAVHKLLEKGMVDVVGRSDSLGRPLLYGTTHFFLEQFGLSSMDDLPDLREIEEILDDPAFNRERAQLLRLRQEEALGGGEDEPEGDATPGAERKEVDEATKE
jgi:segregation and condensation protein B